VKERSPTVFDREDPHGHAVGVLPHDERAPIVCGMPNLALEFIDCPQLFVHGASVHGVTDHPVDALVWQSLAHGLERKVQMGIDTERLCGVHDVAQHLGVSVSWVNQRVQRGQIPVLRVGRRNRFRISDIDRWVDSGDAALDRP